MTETRPHDVAAIKGVLENHYKAWDAGDADAFVADYTGRDGNRGKLRSPGRRHSPPPCSTCRRVSAAR